VFLLAVPFPIILLVQMLLSETRVCRRRFVDGSSALMGEWVSPAVATPNPFKQSTSWSQFTTLLIVLPLAPYAHRLPLSFYIGLLSVGVLSTTYCLVRTPFSRRRPSKPGFSKLLTLRMATILSNFKASPDLYLKSSVKYRRQSRHLLPRCSLTASSIPRFKIAEWEGLSPKISDHQ